MAYKFLSDAKFGFANPGTASDFRPVQELFVRLTKFLDHATGSGVTRIASNYGFNTSGSTIVSSVPLIALNGQGFGYWDESVQAGTNAWAVWRFGNAYTPFYVILQWTDFVSVATTFGTAPGYPGSHPDTSFAGVGIQVAACSDGTAAWAGSTRNDGTDIKRNPAWITGSNGMSFVWPRCNSPGGGTLFSGSRSAFMSVANATLTEGTTNLCRWRLTAALDENNLFIATDNKGNFVYNVFHFGKYVPISGTNPPVPYFCYNSTNASVYTADTSIGAQIPITGSTNTLDGGIAAAVPTRSGTVGTLLLSSFHPGIVADSPGYICPEPPFNNLTASLGTTPGQGNVGWGMYNEFPICLASSEWPTYSQVNFNGTVGYSYDFLRLVPIGVQPGITFNSGSRLCVGSSIASSTPRFTIPWSSSFGQMYTSWTRDGIEV